MSTPQKSSKSPRQPRRPAPFFREDRGLWYVQIKGKQINLGSDQEKAFTKYHTLMAGAEPITDQTEFFVPVELFLSWMKLNRSGLTYRWYKDHLESFCQFNVGKHKSIQLHDLKPFHVTQWLDSAHEGHAADTRIGAVRAIRRAYKWAKSIGHIKVNPLAEWEPEMPGKQPRDVVVEPQQWETVRCLIEPNPQELGYKAKRWEDGNFLDFLTLLKETGCRPFEVMQLEAKHVDKQLKAWVYSRKDSKGKKYKRVVYCTDEAWGITQRLMRKHPEGKLLRNKEGRPWTPSAINCKLRRLKKKLGFKLMPYAFRHSFATEALLRGVDSVIVSKLMGHRDLTMVARVYGHLCQHHGDLRANLAKARGLVVEPMPSASSGASV